MSGKTLSLYALVCLMFVGCISGIDNGGNKKDVPPNPVVKPSTGSLETVLRAAYAEQHATMRAFCQQLKAECDRGEGNYEDRGKRYDAETERLSIKLSADISNAIKAYRAEPGFTESKLWDQMYQGHNQ